MEFTADVLIDADPARVWAIFTRVEEWPDWTASVVSATRLDPGPLAVGTRVRIKQPKLPTTVWTATELTEGRSWTWVATGPGVRTTAVHLVEPHGEGSKVTLRLRQEGWLGALVGRLTAGLTDRYLAMEAEGLKSRAERA
ncbi:SRPBCC family protein [Actinokineospora sp. NPDC004072]